MTDPNNADSIRKNRLTLGFLTYHEDSDYHNQMMAGIFEAARKHDTNIIHFGGFGRSLGDEGLFREIENSLEIIKEQHLDGLMFLGWLPNFVTTFPEDISRLQIPLFSIGAGFKNIPSVHTDGGIYLREILLHLIQVHGCKKIAFISPRSNASDLIDNRVQIYKDLMQEFGLYHPQLLVNAVELNPAGIDFTLRAQKALNVLLDERKAGFDAIVSSYNDQTISILDELKNRGIIIPNEVKIVGYEDDACAKYASIPITTVYYPFWELGFYGCELFIELLTNNNHHETLSNFVPGRVILRNSCGCVSNSIHLTAMEVETLEKTSAQLSKLNQQDIYTEMIKRFPKPLFDLASLLKAFFTDFEMKTNLNFLAAVADQVVTYYQYHHDVSGIEDFISQLHQLILPYLIDRKPDLIRMEALLHQARITIEEKAVNLLGNQTVQTNHLNQILHKISQELITTLHTQKLMDVLELSLLRMNIPACYLFLINREHDFINDATLAFEYHDGRRVPLQAGSPPLYLKDLLRNQPRERIFSLLVYPLSVDDEYLGLALFEPGPLDERIYYTVSVLLSTALKSAKLIENLENANQEIKATQQELVARALQAGMTQVTTGTLHNIANVLNNINTMIIMLKDIVKESPLEDFQRANDLLKNHLPDLADFIISDPKGIKLMQFYLMLETPFNELQNQIYGYLNRLMERINLVNEIISTQQNYVNTRSITEEFDLTDIIADALKMQMDTLEKYHIKIVENYQSVPKTILPRTKLLYILMNVFNNAKDAMKDTPEDKRILTLTLDSDAESIYLQVSDTGQGIPPEILKKIFTFGFTTKQEGHGFGLHSCINYMKEMGGRIWVESPGTGKGAAFTLQFRRKNKKNSVDSGD